MEEDEGVEVEEEELKAILREAFGDSSSDSDGESSHDRRERAQSNDSSDEMVRPDSIFGDSHIWEPIAEIKGLWICRDLLSGDQQSSLLSALEKEGYLTEASHNQAMRFGDLPPWALELSYIIREGVVVSGYFSESTDLINSDERKETCPFPSELLWREPLFNQLIVNIYQPAVHTRCRFQMALMVRVVQSPNNTLGDICSLFSTLCSQGICAHVDLMRFEDGIAIISLESSCVMHFTSVETEVRHKIPVLLTPGSVVLMWGEARFLWKHEINRKPGFQNWQGRELNQQRRTSITLRRLRQTE